MRRSLVWILVPGLILLGYLLLPKGEPSFHGTRLLQPKPLDFTLTGPEGPVRLGAFRDRLVLVFFGYTHCPDVCPTTLMELARVYRALSPREQARVQVIFIDVDPERDPPALADRYAKAFHPSFLGVTGEPEAIQKVAQAFGVYYQKSQYQGPGNYLVDHTASTFVLKGGALVLLYSPDRLQETEKVVADLRALGL